MNAEIKTNDTILINRANDSERLLLSNIYNNFINNDASIDLVDILNSEGDFDGLKLKINSLQSIVDYNIPKYLNLVVGESLSLEVNLPDNDFTILTDISDSSKDNKQINVSTQGNLIKFSPIDNQELGTITIKYSIVSNLNKFKPIIDTITVSIVPRAKAIIYVKTVDSSNNEDVESTISIRDTNDTIIVPNELNFYELEPSTYFIKITSANYETLATSFEVHQDDLSQESVTKEFKLNKIQ